MATERVETVSWINRWGDPRREDYFNGFHPRLAKKVLKTYGVKRPIDLPSQTHIAVDEIDSIEDEDLRDALKDQQEDKEQDAPYLTLPVAFMPSRLFSHYWSVSRRGRRSSSKARRQEAQESV